MRKKTNKQTNNLLLLLNTDNNICIYEEKQSIFYNYKDNRFDLFVKILKLTIKLSDHNEDNVCNSSYWYLKRKNIDKYMIIY